MLCYLIYTSHTIYLLSNQVTKLVKQETESILSMQKAQIDIEQEIRSYTVSEETRVMWKNLSEAPKWLHSDKLLYLEKQKNELIQKIKEKYTNNIAIQDEVDFTSIKTPEYHLIKSGKFGPEIEEFTMLLPPTFPLRAGQSKYALQPVLTQYEKILSKLKIQALPSTIEEAKVGFFLLVLLLFYVLLMYAFILFVCMYCEIVLL